MTSRAAVVIGVGATGGLPPLRAAVSGAQHVAGWLGADGYDVLSITDEHGPVRISQIKDAVGHFVDLGTVERMVVYFAGHGYLNGTAEVWLLSRAPADADEAVDQTVSTEFARTCAIPSVTLVSDCCRSTPAGLQAGRVRGSSIFPNRAETGHDVEVDRLFATRPGDPALELRTLDAVGAYHGLFTSVWQTMHVDPEVALRRVVALDGSRTTVVSNRALKRVLPERVDAAAQERSIRFTQVPEFRLEGGDDAFVARARFTGAGAGPGAADAMQAPPSAAEEDGDASEAVRPPPRDARFALERAARPRRDTPLGDGVRWPFSGTVLAALADDALSAQVRRIRDADHGASGSFSVTGAEVVDAGFRAAGGTMHAPVAGAGRPRADETTGSLLLTLTGGVRTMVAAIPGHVPSVTVEDGRVVNVSYLATPRGPGAELADHVRAIAAMAARNGMLATDKVEARAFAAFVEWFAPTDPTLSLYAALALADLGLSRHVTAIRDRSRVALGVDLRDLAILAGDPDRAWSGPRTPGWPMLGATWSFMRARGMDRVDPACDTAEYRVPALWTTFQGSAPTPQAS